MTEDLTKGDKRRRSTAKKLRNLGMRAQAAAGKPVTEIAAEAGISRQAASKILNSDETKALLTESEDRIKGLISKAIKRLDDSISFADDTNALKAALSVLKSFGLVRETLKLEHSFPKPVVIDYGDGKREKFTAHREGDEDKDDG